MVKRSATNYSLKLGGMLIKDCDGAIVIPGRGAKKQILRFRIGDDEKLLVNAHVYDKDGSLICRFYNSRPVHVADGYETESTGSRCIVRNKITNEVVFDLEYLGSMKVKINGIFWENGTKIEATDDCLKIGGISFTNCLSENNKAGISLDIRGVGRS